MYPHLNNVWRIALIAAGLTATLATASESRRTDFDHIASVRAWLPHNHAELQLIFEYDSANPEHDSITAKTMHRAIDRAGATVTVLQALTPYDRSPRTIGGYNPYKWKSVFGRYEVSPGRFIFDLDKERKWERQTERRGTFAAKAQDFGLSFGEGDLVVNPDLRSGSAQNHTFAPPGQTSVLTGQAGPFEIKSIKIYKIVAEERESAAPSPYVRAGETYVRASKSYGRTKPSPVPDSSSLWYELAAIALLLIWARRSFAST